MCYRLQFDSGSYKEREEFATEPVIISIRTPPTPRLAARGKIVGKKRLRNGDRLEATRMCHRAMFSRRGHSGPSLQFGREPAPAKS